MDNNKKIADKIIDNMSWSRGPQNSWCGTYVFSNGYSVSCIADPMMKMREAKAYIRESLVQLVMKTAAEENITIA